MRYLFPTGKGYQRKWLGQDVLSGVVIAAVSIPISMGYAQIAGLPAVYGLYGSLLPVILFALLSTSPQFIFGVDAAPAAMIGGVLGGMGIAMGSAEAERVVPVLTFYVGIWLLLFALLRAGRVLRFVSTSVMGGFISGICCTIILMQLPKLMGGTAGTGELPELVRHLAGVQVHPLSLGLGAAALVILLAAKRLRPKFPMAIVVMGLGALATVLFDLPGRGVACLGAVEPGLPALHLPDWSAVSLTEGLGSSLPVAVVIMAETLLAESSFAMRDGYEIRDSQELLAFAAAVYGQENILEKGLEGRSAADVISRRYVTPLRLVALPGELTAGVENPEALLRNFDGQLTTGTPDVCRLSTRDGCSASVLLDFGKELCGGIALSAATPRWPAPRTSIRCAILRSACRGWAMSRPGTQGSASCGSTWWSPMRSSI